MQNTVFLSSILQEKYELSSKTLSPQELKSNLTLKSFIDSKLVLVQQHVRIEKIGLCPTNFLLLQKHYCVEKSILLEEITKNTELSGYISV